VPGALPEGAGASGKEKGVFSFSSFLSYSVNNADSIKLYCIFDVAISNETGTIAFSVIA
jgi:hypothetical protein